MIKLIKLSLSQLFTTSLSMAMLFSSATTSFAASKAPQDMMWSAQSIDQSINNKQETRTFRVVRIYSGSRPNILIKSIATGREFDVYYSSRIGAEVGDIITVTFNGDRWINIINNRTGLSASVTSVS